MEARVSLSPNLRRDILSLLLLSIHLKQFTRCSPHARVRVLYKGRDIRGQESLWGILAITYSGEISNHKNNGYDER